jgi:pimeloyl-ACP methyl ester carboxylesterase
LLAGPLLFSACTIVGLKQHLENMEAFGVVTVRVSPPPDGSKPTYALAWIEKQSQLRSAGLQRIGADGVASFILRIDRTYYIGAFTDLNGNQSYDVGEPGDYIPGVTPVSLGESADKVKVLELTLHSGHNLPPGTTIAIPEEDKELGRQLDLALGEIASFDDPQFTTDAGGSGLWRPLDFLSHNQPGIYFMEPYDPNRIPVLLVYGIGGTPQDMRYLAEHFDRKRYQVWLFHYPSGMRLDRVSRSMATGLLILKERYGFLRCDVVAHSMGGLVARSAINQAVQIAGVNYIPRFVSISTPWGGHSAASAGIRRLRKPVPSWIDVAPESDFLKKIYATPLAPGTLHLLIYGSKEGGPFWLKGANDGVVTVESETDPRIKKNAAKVVYLPFGHVDILEQEKTLAETLKFIGADQGR